MTEEYITHLCDNENLGELDYVMYVLRSQTKSNMIYCGMTNNIQRRLRQHNGYIKGGGKYTSANRPWHLAVLIPIDGGNTAPAKSLALKVEYWTKAKNYPVSGGAGFGAGFEATDYVRPARREIPRNGAVERRIWLLRETIRRHQLPEPMWFDDDFKEAWNLLADYS